MIRFLLKKIISRQKELILQEASRIQDFMRLLMKLRNTGKKWTREEKKQLKLHIIHLSVYVPVLIIFLLPGGSLLIPILADILERRKKKERLIQQDADLVSKRNKYEK
ncbi:MAG: hypothetical protein HZB30_12170 [Nitrospirae bacterium]|nr:hypothetical protein [Nitrospirota bacterium]